MERIASPGDRAALHEGESVEERLTAMTRLCRAAWLATGQPWPPTGRAHRASLPVRCTFQTMPALELPDDFRDLLVALYPGVAAGVPRSSRGCTPE